jgi:hypothetical protein
MDALIFSPATSTRKADKISEINLNKTLKSEIIRGKGHFISTETRIMNSTGFLVEDNERIILKSANGHLIPIRMATIKKKKGKRKCR